MSHNPPHNDDRFNDNLDPAPYTEQEDRSGMRAAILAAARELFSEVGYEATTMRKIAEHIGYSATAIYRHFPDKRTILTELVNRDFMTLSSSFAAVLAEPNPVVRLSLFGRNYIEFGLRYPNHYRLMFMTRKVTTTLEDLECGPGIRKGDPTQDAFAALVATVHEAIALDIFRPELTDPEAIAQILWACLHGLVCLYLDHGKDAWIEWRPIRSLADETLRMMMVGLARPEAMAKFQGVL